MAGMTKPRVLIVEDDALFLASMRALLTNAGYEVAATTVSTDRKLPDMVREADVVMLDLAMPGKDGFEVLREIRQAPDTASKPVLMLTAHDPMTYRLKGLSLGADDYVVKPPHRDELLLRIGGLLRRAQLAAPSEAPRAGNRIKVDSPRGGHAFVNTADVTHITAAGNYCYVYTQDGRKMSSANIGQLAEDLGEAFVRTHRSHLVNLARITGARWLDSSNYVLEIDDADHTQIPVSRAYRAPVRIALGVADAG